jgi:hypothetical protein
MIIEKSAVVATEKVKKPGTKDEVELSDLSRTGAFANAYEAVKMASTIKPAIPANKPVTKKKSK